MAKQGRTIPGRRPRTSGEDTLLIRSAESLGRMIGSLQRQLDGVSRKIPTSARASSLLGIDEYEDNDRATTRKKTTKKTGMAKKTKGATRAGKGGGKSGAKKTQSTADRTSKRASKSAAARKTAGRGRSGASRKAKSSR
jgi:chromatin remodeling complex protein RSC6